MALIRSPLSVSDGSFIRIRVTHDQGTILQLRQASRAIPQPIVIDALIDPGAQQSCIDPAIVNQLGLAIYAFNFSAAPGTTQSPIPIFGNVGVNTSHMADLHVIHSTHDLVIPDLIIQALELRPLGIDAFIGRDVLASCVLVYDGPAGLVTLAY